MPWESVLQGLICLLGGTLILVIVAGEAWLRGTISPWGERLVDGWCLIVLGGMIILAIMAMFY